MVIKMKTTPWAVSVDAVLDTSLCLMTFKIISQSNDGCVCVFSPEISPLKSVPQIRIDMDPDDDGSFYWKSRRSETSL